MFCLFGSTQTLASQLDRSIDPARFNALASYALEGSFACAPRGFRAKPKRGFELVVPRRLTLQWHLILNLVPRVFSLSNMAAAGQRTLTHSRNHVIDLSTKSGNLFKMAAKIKRERIWVRGIEMGEKQTKWRQRQTQKKLKICKNSLTSHRNMVD